MSSRSAIVYLAQKTPERLGYLVESLRRLFDAFNARSGHPVLIFHEGDFSGADQDHVRRALPHDAGTVVSFVRLAGHHFEAPSWMSERIVQDNKMAVPWTRGIKYRSMCRWWLKHLPEYLDDYDVYMRVDDDLYFEGTIPDPIGAVVGAGVDYASNCIHIEDPLNALGLSAFTRTVLGERARLSGLLLPAALEPARRPNLVRFVAGLPRHLRDLIEPGQLDAPIMYYNNFHVARRRVWRCKGLIDYFSAVDESGGQYYLRWGDAPVQTLAVVALGFSVGRFDFRYSKRHERCGGAFVNSSHLAARTFMGSEFHSSARHTGCMTLFPSFNKALQDRGIADMAGVIGAN